MGGELAYFELHLGDAARAERFAVDDIEAAIATIRSLGGQASEVMSTPTGRFAHCRDDQGLAFSLFQFA